MSLTTLWKQRIATRLPTVHWKIVRYKTKPKYVESNDGGGLFYYGGGQSSSYTVMTADGKAAYVGACALRKKHDEECGGNIEFLEWVGITDGTPTCVECKWLYDKRPQ